jgi:hypothetical protein
LAARCLDQHRIDARRRDERIGLALQRGGEARDIQPGLHQVAPDAVLIGGVGGGVEFEQQVAGVDMIAVGDADRFDDADFERLNQLDLTRGDDAAGRGGDCSLSSIRIPDRRMTITSAGSLFYEFRRSEPRCG